MIADDHKRLESKSEVFLLRAKDLKHAEIGARIRARGKVEISEHTPRAAISPRLLLDTMILVV